MFTLTHAQVVQTLRELQILIICRKLEVLLVEIIDSCVEFLLKLLDDKLLTLSPYKRYLLNTLEYRLLLFALEALLSSLCIKVQNVFNGSVSSRISPRLDRLKGVLCFET